MRDLEIRGAGNLLGSQAAWHMEAVGYDLYCKMLNEAVKEAKGMEVAESFDTSIDIDIDAYIPMGYIPNEMQKLDIYKRIAGIETADESEEMLEELIDRFGDPPKSVEICLYCKGKIHGTSSLLYRYCTEKVIHCGSPCMRKRRSMWRQFRSLPLPLTNM